MEKDLVSRIITRIDSFPTLPSVVTNLIQLTSDPESTIDQLLGTIQRDPSLSVNILKFANSAFFGRVMGVSSLKEAVSVLGVSEIRNIVLAKAVFNSFRHVKNTELFDIQKFWEHSFLCGLTAKIIAADLKLNASDLFIAGLIHDIGKLVFCIEIPEKLIEAAEAQLDSPYKIYKNEKKNIGISHDKAGLMLLNKWLFPENLLMAVGYHHRPRHAEASSIFPVIIHVADMMIYQLKICMENDVDMNLAKTLVNHETVSLLGSHNFQWDLNMVQNIADQLNLQKQDSESVLKELSS